MQSNFSFTCDHCHHTTFDRVLRPGAVFRSCERCRRNYRAQFFLTRAGLRCLADGVWVRSIAGGSSSSVALARGVGGRS
jgi:hypothetical protein